MPAVVDTSQLQAHAYALVSSGPIVRKAVEAATKLAAQRVQMTAQAGFGGTTYWRATPRDITFDTAAKGTLIEAEIGRKRGIGGQSALLHLLEFGSSRFGPIKPTLVPALEANQEPYEKALLAAAMVATMAAT